MFADESVARESSQASLHRLRFLDEGDGELPATASASHAPAPRSSCLLTLMSSPPLSRVRVWSYGVDKTNGILRARAAHRPTRVAAGEAAARAPRGAAEAALTRAAGR